MKGTIFFELILLTKRCLFKTIKVEWIYPRTFINQAHATLSIFEWIESWYNKKRRHSFLNYKTIDEFDKININFVTAA